MMNVGYMLILLLTVSTSSTFIINDAYGQTTIDVGESSPCFMNYTAGVNLWENCKFGGPDGDWLSATVLPFEWVTGGYFTFIIVAILVVMTYIKYHEPLYPLAIGVLYIPVAIFVIPEELASAAWIFAGVIIGSSIAFAYLQRTRMLT